MKAQRLCNTYQTCIGSLGVVCERFINRIKKLRDKVTATEIRAKKYFGEKPWVLST